MSQTDRIVRIRTLLGVRRVVSRRALPEILDVSPATLKRDLAYLRDNMNTPMGFDRQQCGYRIDPGAQVALPRMCFSDKEIHALLTVQHLLANLVPGVLFSEHRLPDPRGRYEPRGSCILQVPCTDHREMLMDVLKHGRHCEVLGPVDLRLQVAEEIACMSDKLAQPSPLGHSVSLDPNRMNANDKRDSS